MCEICEKHFCPPSCPSFNGISLGKGKILGTCKNCGKAIFQGDCGVRKSEILLCEHCAALAESNLALRIRKYIKT